MENREFTLQDGLGKKKNFNLAIKKIFKKMSLVNKNWIHYNRAQFICCLTLFWPTGKSYTSKGVIKGRISHLKKGKKGFGYDPIFIPLRKKITFGQMLKSKKIKMDHRYIAFQKLKKKIKI